MSRRTGGHARKISKRIRVERVRKIARADCGHRLAVGRLIVTHVRYTLESVQAAAKSWDDSALVPDPVPWTRCLPCALRIDPRDYSRVELAKIRTRDRPAKDAKNDHRSYLPSHSLLFALASAWSDCSDEQAASSVNLFLLEHFSDEVHVSGKFRDRISSRAAGKPVRRWAETHVMCPDSCDWDHLVDLRYDRDGNLYAEDQAIVKGLEFYHDCPLSVPNGIKG